MDDMFLQIGDLQNPQWEQYNFRIKEKYSFKDNKDYWVTREGNKIYPHQMDTNHIKGTIRMIEKNCNRRNLKSTDYKIYNLLVDELTRR